MKRFVPPLLLLAFGVAAVPAGAATVSGKVRDPDALEPYGVFHFRAAVGERNRLTVFERRGGVVVRDTGARLRVRGACRALDAHTARCPATDYALGVALGDGDDRALLRVGRLTVRAGAGDDRVRATRTFTTAIGGAGDDVLQGGKGRDELTGGPGRDQLLGGAGEDLLVDGETDAQAAPDVVDGGSNPDGKGDVVDYSARSAPITATVGEPAVLEDAVAGLEGLTGGAGDDVLVGDGVANALDGGAGDDRLAGGDGDDLLVGGPGDDALAGDAGDDGLSGDAGVDDLRGGDGDDNLAALGGGADRLDCEAGADTMMSDVADRVAASCETLFAFNNALRAGTVPMVDGQTATLMLGCDPCSGRVTLSVAGEPVGATSFSLDAYELAPVTVPLSRLVPAGAELVVSYVSDKDDSAESPGGYTLAASASTSN